MTKRPNILWVCTDQQRWDTIRALGNAHIRTPAMDRLCASGTAFMRCYTQSPICTPARASMMTGRYPATHQVQRNGNAFWPAHEVVVTKRLADAGYDCGLIGKLHLSAAKYHERRSDDGYRVFQWNHHPTPDAARGHPIGEIFDQHSDPGEFENLWHDIALRAERLKIHLDAVAGTISAGPPRSSAY